MTPLKSYVAFSHIVQPRTRITSISMLDLDSNQLLGLLSKFPNTIFPRDSEHSERDNSIAAKIKPLYCTSEQEILALTNAERS